MIITGLGSLPGTDFAGAVRSVFESAPDLPYLPELPDRGAGADMTGRACAALAGLSVDLQPAGWRLTSGSSRAGARARATLRRDLDDLEDGELDDADELEDFEDEDEDGLDEEELQDDERRD